MSRFRPIAVIALVALALTGFGCARPEGGSGAGASSAARSGKLTVLVDSYPLAYFAQRIGGDLVEVSFPAPPGVDPSFWKPDADTIALYQKADLILINGAGFAAWVDTATLPGSRVVDTSAAITDRLLPLEGAVTHSHGGMGEHSHSGFATRLWLDPTLAAAQATAIASAFAAARPDDKTSFEQGLAALRGDLEALDSKLTALAEPHRRHAAALLASRLRLPDPPLRPQRPIAPLGADRGARVTSPWRSSTRSSKATRPSCWCGRRRRWPRPPPSSSAAASRAWCSIRWPRRPRAATTCP